MARVRSSYLLFLTLWLVLIGIPSFAAAQVFFVPGKTVGSFDSAAQQKQLSGAMPGQQIITGDQTAFNNYLKSQQAAGQPARVVDYSAGGDALSGQIAACKQAGQGTCQFQLVDPSYNQAGTEAALSNYLKDNPNSVNLMCTSNSISALCSSNTFNTVKSSCDTTNHLDALGNCNVQNQMSGTAPGTDKYNPELGGDSASPGPQSFVDPECDKYFGLGSGTQRFSWDRKYLNKDYCEAVKDLVKRYTPGSCSSTGLKNPKIDGIIKLNPDFAIALDKMLKASPGININSAYRAQPCKNADGVAAQDSNHMYGCAVDLAYDQTSCNSSACQWVQKNSGTYGLQLRLKYSPEWNHLEPNNIPQCRSKAPGGGVTPDATSPAADQAAREQAQRQALDQAQALNDKLGCTSSSVQNGQFICIKSGNPSISSGNTGGGLGSNSAMQLMLGFMAGNMLGGLLNSSSNNQNQQPSSAPAAPLPLPLPPPINPIPITPTKTDCTVSDLLGKLCQAQQVAQNSGTNSSGCIIWKCVDAATSTPATPVATTSTTTAPIETPNPPTTTTATTTLDATSTQYLNNALISLQAASSTLTTGDVQSTSTLQTVLDSISSAFGYLAQFVGRIFGIGAGSASP